MIICPNLSNPLVAQEFEELKNAVGETAAYHIWSLNNGYNIDSAPNGEPSILFQSLLKEFNGDRREAIRAKAKTYSNSFIKWFGDWINDPTNASKVVDKNGEPLVVYHNSKTKELDEFDMNKVKPNSLFGPGIYTSTDTEYNSLFGNIKNTLFVNIKKPLYAYTSKSDDIDVSMFLYDVYGLKAVPEKYKALYDGVFGQYEDHIEYVSWNANQIKSATDNNGMFSTENDNIHALDNGQYGQSLKIYEKLSKILSKKPSNNFQMGEWLAFRLKDSLGSFVSQYIGDLYNQCKSLEEFYSALDFIVYNELFQNVIPQKIEKLQRFVDSVPFINPAYFFKNLFEWMESGVVTGEKDHDVKTIGERNVKRIEKVFPKFYSKPLNKRRAGMFKHMYYNEKGSYDSIFENDNKYILASISSIKKLKRLLEADQQILGLKLLIIKKVNKEVLNYYKNNKEEENNYKNNNNVDYTESPASEAYDVFLCNYLFPKGFDTVYSMTDVLKRMSVVSDDAKTAYNVIKDTLKGDCNIVFTNNKKESTGGWAISVSGRNIKGDPYDEYETNHATIKLNYSSELFLKDTVHTVLHEIIHTLSSVYLEDPKNIEIKNELDLYLDYLRNYDPGRILFFNITYDIQLIYGLKNSHEFVAEYFSNPNFQDWLKQIPPVKDEKAKSLFHEIFNAILKLFGISDTNSAYDQLYPVMLQIISATSSQYDMVDIVDVLGEDSPVLSRFKLHLSKTKKADTEILETVYDQIKEAPKIEIELDLARSSAVQNAVLSLIQLHPLTTLSQVSDIITLTEERFNQALLQVVGNSTVKTLMQAYGLEQQIDEDGNISLVGNDIAVQFVQYLQDEFGEHDGWYDYNSSSTAAHHLIQVALNGDEISTFSHELAHHYIRMFFNTPLIQNSLGAVYKKGMTLQELEEALVDEITSRLPLILDEKDFQKTFYSKFWSKFSEMIAKLFNIKNNTYKNDLLRNATRAFLINENQQTNPKYRAKFDKYEGRLYKDKNEYTKRKEKSQEEAKKNRFKSHYIKVGDHSEDQKAVKLIVEGGIRRKSGLEKSPSMTDKEIVQINAFEQHLLEFVDAINEQRKLEKERLISIGLSERKAKRQMADTEEEKRLNVGIITDFLDNADRELNMVVDRFRSAQSSRYMKLTIRRDEDETTGDVRTLYVNSNEYGSDENVHQLDFSFEELSRLGRDTISYYSDTIALIEQMLENYYVRRLYSKEDLQRIGDKMEAVKKKTDKISVLYKDALKERSIMFVNEYAENIIAEIDDKKKDKNKTDDKEKTMRERLQINMRKWIDGQYDLGMGSRSSIHAWLEPLIGIGEWSQSPVIKMMHQMVFDANTENEDKLRKRRNELYISREKAKKALGFSGLKYLFKSFDKQFMEVDENGLPTGNMLSKINRGRYFLKRADFLDELLLGKDGIENKLRKALGDPNYTLAIDSDGFPVFPQDERATDAEIEYTVKYDKFLSENTQRQYTPEYYRKRLQILCDLNDDMSVKPTSDTKALHAQNDIQSKIEKIVGPCTIDGKVHTELLEDSELIQLLILENKRRLLSSPYDDYGREKEPGTDEYIIYKRLDLWKRFIDKCNIVYTVDEEAFNLSAENAKNKKRFRKLNRYRKINDRFWKLYNDTLGNNKNDEILDDLKRKRSQLVAIIKPRGLLLTDFSVVWDENEGAIRPEWVPFFENLKKLDTQIKNRELELSKNKKRTSKQALFIESMLDVRDSIYKDGEEPQTWFVHMSKGIKKRHYATNAPGAKRNAEEEIRNLLMYKASDGKNRELSLFTTTYPKQSTLKDKDGEFKAVIFEPIHAYSRINVEESSGQWVNKEYDHNSDETVQPKGFDNPDFEKIAGEKAPAAVREYYELLKQTMEESYLNIPFLRKYNMMLPQRAARTSTVLYRSRLWGCWKYLWNRFWSLNEEDTDINEVYFKERSDRTITGSVPVRYIKRLDRPEFVSSDLMSTVLSFYSMSLNYDSHSKLAPIFKSLHEQMIIKNPTSKQALVVKGMIYRQIYGKKTTGMPDGVLSKWMKVLIKFIQRTRVGSMIALLGYSGIAAVVAVLDALTSGVVDVTTRRSFGYSDLMWAIGKMMQQTPAVVSNIGAVKKGQIFGYGTLPQMLEEFGLDGDVSRSTINSDVNRIRRIFNDGIITTSAMAPWSAGEHFINSLTLLLNMSSYRLYNGQFLSRSEFLKTAMQDGLTRMQARVKYQKATKLYNAYKIDKNTGLVKKANNDGGRALSNMSDLEYRKFKNRVTAKGVSKAASYNALVPEFERTQFQSNIIFSWVSMMRNFLLIAFWERFADLNDFYDPGIEDGMSEGDKKNMRRELGEYAGGLNMMTGEVTTGRTRAFFNQIAPFIKVALPFLGESGEWQKAQCSAMVKYLWKQVSDKHFDKYEYRKEHHLSEAQLHGFNIALNEIIAIGLFVYLSTWFHNKYNDDNEDEYWFQAIDTVLLRLPIERFTVWNVGTIMEIINSITAGKTVFDRIVVGDFIKLAMKDYLNHGTEFGKYEEVKRGAFKGEKILFRDALKIMSFLGFYNLYRTTHTESIKSAKRFYEKLGGFNPSSWWRKSDDNKKKDKSSSKSKDITVVI